MAEWDPKSLWEQLRRQFDDWMDREAEGDPEQADDPTLLFHLLFTAPFVIGLLMLVRRA